MDDQHEPGVGDIRPDGVGVGVSGSGPNRVLVLIGLLFVGALVLTLAVLALTGPKSYPADSPEGVVQRYVQALVERDAKTAMSQLTPKLARQCRVDIEDYGATQQRVVLLESRIDEPAAHVDVRIISDSSSGPFGDGRWERSGSFELNRRDGTWEISETPLPRWCGN